MISHGFDKLFSFGSTAALALALAGAAQAAQPALTIYNQNFAVVRDEVELDLQTGVTIVNYAGVTLYLEPDSVVLRDPRGQIALRVLEQSYRADTLSQAYLLSQFEGQELDFLVTGVTAKEYLVKGRVIRSGYRPSQGTRGGRGGLDLEADSPIIEVEGKLRFTLPGEPLFPALQGDAILKPTLTWHLESERAARFNAELSYITGGLSWEVAYNLIAEEKGDRLDLVGWVTIQNQSGKTFPQASIKLMAGDVSKLPEGDVIRLQAMELQAARAYAATPAVTEKAFDEFHLYSLARPTTLRNRETKQVEFLRATGVNSPTLYVYDGAAIDARSRHWSSDVIRANRDFGTQSNPKIWVMREFKNSEENGLGVPLPKGRTRFYRRDEADGRLEFTGENIIDHTPKNETLRVYTGDAFDLVGERKRTDYQVSNRQDQMEEAFEITLRNRKSEPVEVRVIEHLYRGSNAEIIEKSAEFTRTDVQTIEFRMNVPADGESKLTYRVRYRWQ